MELPIDTTYVYFFAYVHKYFIIYLNTKKVQKIISYVKSFTLS